jgi:hypothetical protein
MKTEIKYLELKSGFAGNGPAWVGLYHSLKVAKPSILTERLFNVLALTESAGIFTRLKAETNIGFQESKKICPTDINLAEDQS